MFQIDFTGLLRKTEKCLELVPSPLLHYELV